MHLRNMLKEADEGLYAIFEALTHEMSPLLNSVATQFPDFTRHDPSHNHKLESIAFDLIRPESRDFLTADDVFVLLSSLWIHDASMGQDHSIRARLITSREYTEKLNRFQRLGKDENECWYEYLRENHYNLCGEVALKYLGKKVSKFYIEWIGKIAESHGERRLHDTSHWYKEVKVGDGRLIHPVVLAVIMRLADILHFGDERAPEYMLEHRNIVNMASVKHWRAHQASADYLISDGICHFDGVSDDDESYWFADQFIRTMDDEVKYSLQSVLPYQNPEFRELLSFSRVENRIRPSGFHADLNGGPVTLRVDTANLLEDLLNSSLYGGKPIWFREILQNCFDACRDMLEIDKTSNPCVDIKVDSVHNTISFADKGIGMTKQTVESYLLVAGASLWTSEEYISSMQYKVGHVGKFGIGFMSVFGIAECVVVETRHRSSDECWRFVIRSPRRCVRVEKCSRDKPGTTVIIHTTMNEMMTNPPLELFEGNCSFPEFPVRMEIDGHVEVDIPHSIHPNTVDSTITLTSEAKPCSKAKLSKFDICTEGINGDFYIPKILLESLGCFIPDVRTWLHNTGWKFTQKSATYYGGIDYPRIHALGGIDGFTHLPSLGCLRVSISPNVYPLEMTLARDSFTPGPGCFRLLHEICAVVDEKFESDLLEELHDKGDKSQRSAIAALYSASMLHLWTGQVPSLPFIASNPNRPYQAVMTNPWPKLSNIMKQEMRFRLSDLCGHVHEESVGSLIRSTKPVLAGGLVNGYISKDFIRAIESFDNSARIIVGIPEQGFGIKDLQQYAKEEILIPISEHARSVYGLRFGGERPFEFYPRECDHFGIPIATSIPQYAVVDYRDFMAEVEYRPTGSNRIIGVLNRKNTKVTCLLKALSRYRDFPSLKRVAYDAVKDLHLAMHFGTDKRYNKNSREGLTKALNSLVCALTNSGSGGLVEFDLTDFPEYLDGCESMAFGRPTLSNHVVNAYRQIQQYDGLFLSLT